MPFDILHSERIRVFKFPTVNFPIDTSELLNSIIDVLSGNAAEYLPEDWSNVDSVLKTEAWLKQRLSECELFIVLEQDSRTVLGLLFIYGYEQGKSDQTVRIGYVIAEKFWGI